MRNLPKWVFLIAIASMANANSWCLADSPAPPVARPLAPDEALKQFQLPAELKIELVAAEPEVMDPVAAAFDEDGRLWVVEMGDYPTPAQGQPPQSRVKLLSDKDGDGRYETSQVFADGLLFCNGLQPWRGGLIVTLAGEVAYLRDNDGDGHSDIRETWFTGFKAENSQLRANHPTLALDNHIYVANGLRDGEIVAAREKWREGAKPLSIRGMDFRFDPRNGKYDAVTGQGQFGLAFDDFGNRFICSNRNPCVQVMLENRYLGRNRHLAVSSVVQDVSPPAEKSRLFPVSRAWTTSNIHARQFTAACGVTIYRGDALPEAYRGNSFTCEPTGNLVHRDVLEIDGATFDARPNTSETEFLASPDEWFRPVNLAQGPDGALYVIDMYRAVIEHPDFMPDELKNRLENHWGKDRGRIYRIVPDNQPAANRRRQTPKLSAASNVELIVTLEHANSWHRETATRLLLERGDPSACDQLRTLAHHGKSPQARIHALWLLHGFDQLTQDIVLTALNDTDPRVRSHAVRMAEPWLNTNIEMRQRVLALADDDNVRLRFQVALSLGEISPDTQPAEIATALANIALRDAGDRWIRAAVATSLAQRAPAVLTIVLRRAIEFDPRSHPGATDLVSELAQLVAANQNAAEIGAAIAELEPFVAIAAPSSASHGQTSLARGTNSDATNDPSRLEIALACLHGLGQGASRRGQSLAAVAAQFDDRQRRCFQDLISKALGLAKNPEVESQRRCRSVRSLRYADFASVGDELLRLAADKKDQNIRLAALETLATFEDPLIGPALLADFNQQTPAVRRTIVAAMLDKPSRAALLLDELETRGIALTELQPDQWQRLAMHGNSELKQRATRLQAAAVPANRQEVVNKYRAALDLAADPNRGRQVFTKNCAACHRVANVGVNIAPDISDTRDKRPEQFLVDILDPNRAIDNNYFSYTLTLMDGQVQTGLIGAETATSVTLRQQDNKLVTVLREDIDTLRSNGVSLMPTGLEQSISIEQMADLISFLKNWRYLKE